MKKLFIFLFALLPFLAGAQDEELSPITIGINTGIDNNINAYKLDPNNDGNNFTSGNSHYNIGLDFGVMASQKFRPRLELRFVQLSYKADWVNTSFTTMKETDVKLYNFDINFRLDYLLLNSGKFQIFASPALKWEFNVDKENKNIKYDGTYNYRQYNDIVNENPKNILGGAVSAILKYNVTKHIGVTLTPEYTLFFREFVKTNDNIYQRASVNFGLEFRF